MLLHHLKFFIRKVRKDFFAYAIGYIGLVIGLSIFSLLGIYAYQEFSHGTYVADHDKIYRLHFLSSRADKQAEFAISHGFLAEKLRTDFPQVASATRLLITQQESVFRIDNREFNIAQGTAFFTDEHFFEVFDLPTIAGNKTTALSDPNAIVITESFAYRLFGSVDVVGQTITSVWGSDKYPLRVSAVLEDLPTISHFQFDYIMPGAFLSTWDRLAKPTSGNTNYVYLKAKNVMVQEEFDKTLSNVTSEVRQKPTPMKSIRLRDIHFYPPASFEHATTGNKDQVILIAIGGLILLIASMINYLIIHVSQLTDRTKEIGIRQSMGISRIQMAQQFIAESGLSILVVAALTGFISFWLYENFFHQMIGYDLLNHELLGYLALVLGLLLMIASVSVIIALIRTKRNRSSIVDNATAHSKQNHYALTLQYSFAMLTVIGSFFVWKQLSYLQELDIGYSTDYRINIARPGGIESNKWSQFKTSTSAIPGVEAVGGGLYRWIGTAYNSTGIRISHGPLSSSDSTIQVTYNYVDDQMIPTLGLELIQGRNFDRALAEDTFNIIVNETAVRALGASDIVGKSFHSWIFNERSGKVVGVVKDFHYQNIEQKVLPTVLFFQTRNLWAENLVIRIDPANMQNTINQLSTEWNEAGMTGPFSYAFLDQFQARLFERETQNAQFMGITASCSIMVALIGLIGLVSFQNKRRSKELSLRKVFGASVSQLLLMINKTYLILIGLSIAVSVPIAYWAVSQWLQGYAYRISPSIWDFVVVVAAVISVSLVTVSLQSWKTANSNPTEVLRAE